ncbi:MAG TPA: acyl-CoA dehydrogenase family protein [Candidatus Polarisedimenticolia bacterium]|jgi:acyl-CoA dehydrogenase
MAPSILTESERALAAAARQAVARLEVREAPAGDHAAEEAAARRALEVLSEAGLPGHAMPGPSGRLAVRSICVIREELAWASGLADAMFVMQGLGSCALALAGTDETRRRYLPGVAGGRIIAALALTEPHAGSDLGAIATRARRDGGHYVLDGVKTYISNAGIAGLYTVFARTSEGGRPQDGISAFAVDGANPGLKVTERLTVSAPHPIGTIEMSACRVEASGRLGEEGEGHGLALRVLDRFRPTVGAAAVGFARRGLEESVSRARSRRQFGRAIGEFQAIRFKLADMAVWLDAARLLVMRAASLLDADAGDAASRSPAGTRRASSMAKLYATEAAQRIVDEAVQIHGALGVTRGHVVERLYREVRALRIYEGTSEIQRAIIARTLLQEGA